MMGKRLRLGAEDGSLPLAMLAVLIIGGLVTTVVASTITSQHAVRFDERFTEVLHGADAGVQEALFRANHGTLEATASPVTGTIGDAAYAWTASQTGSRQWLVTSTGTQGGADRTVQAVIEEPPRFHLAAFADTLIGFRGSNGADSYNSATGQWDTGNGAVGTNGSIDLNGNSTHADQVYLFNWAADPNPGRCVHSGGSDCDDPNTVDQPMALASDQEMGFITEQLAACAAAGPLAAWVASEHGGLLDAPDSGVLCFESMTFDVDTTVNATADNPAVVYVRDTISVGRHVAVNCAGCAAGTSTPVARSLQLYGGGGGPVLLGNQSTIAGSIYAPRSACQGNPSNAQATIYGSLYCQTIDNQGGWSFHFDDALLDIGSGDFGVTQWTEQ